MKLQAENDVTIRSVDHGLLVMFNTMCSSLLYTVYKTIVVCVFLGVRSVALPISEPEVTPPLESSTTVPN